MDISELTNDDLFSLLLCGKESSESYNVQDYVNECAFRCGIKRIEE